MRPDEACIRCGRKGRPTGLRRPEGAVCNSCAPWFREPEQCPRCGRMSRRLARVLRLGIDEPVCPSCQRADHATCQACGRHRRLFEAEDGRLLCRRCMEEGTRLCGRCGNPMPAGQGKRCGECYWKELLEKRIRICQAGLGNGLAEEFWVFGRWLETRRGAHVAALKISKYLEFFQEIDAIWGHVPSYRELVARFHAEGLRRVRLAVRWMEESGRLEVDEKVREEDSERRRIRELKEGIDASTAGGALWHAFRKRLMARLEEGRTSLRSIRMVLSASADLVRRAEGCVPVQPDLDAYLVDKPGQRANITGFVNFINEAQGMSLVPQTDDRRAKERSRARLERQLIAMMKNPEDTQEFRTKWAKAAVRYFHGRNLPKDGNLRDAPRDGLLACVNGQDYWVPLPRTGEAS